MVIINAMIVINAMVVMNAVVVINAMVVRTWRRICPDYFGVDDWFAASVMVALLLLQKQSVQPVESRPPLSKDPSPLPAVDTHLLTLLLF